MKINEYKVFRNEKRCDGEVTVYTESKEYADCFAQKQKAPQVNWNCFGSVSIERAEKFNKLLTQAIKYAKSQKKKYYKGDNNE